MPPQSKLKQNFRAAVPFFANISLCSGETEILHELVNETTRISS